MKRVLVCVCVLLAAAVAADALDAYPKTSIAEDATATWCGYCPDAYAGLDVGHGMYDYGEFISVRYYATSGDYGTAETDAALAYYGVEAFPTVIFNGTQALAGGGDAIASGLPYLSILEGAYFEPAPVKVEIDSFDSASGAIEATVTMFSNSDVLDGDRVLFVLLEDGITAAHTHAARDIIIDSISLGGAGQSVSFAHSFDLDAGWVTENLWAVVYVQRTADREVLQAACTKEAPLYRARAMVADSLMQIGASTEPYEGANFVVYNVGLDDSYQLELVVDSAPEGWQAWFVDGAGTRFDESKSFSLHADQFAGFHVVIDPGSPGTMDYHFELSSPNLTEPLLIPFSFFTDDLDALVVDDDGGEDFETYLTAALDSLGLAYGVWDLSSAKLTPATAAFSTLVWNVGWSFPSLDSTDRDYLAAYLDNGGSLFITGQDIGWDLNENDDNLAVEFYSRYLQASYGRDDTNKLFLDGVNGDPIGDGLSLNIFGGDGASNQQYPSEIRPADTRAAAILNYQGDGCAAIRGENYVTGARVVYLAFGFEAIDNATDRATLMERSMDFLQAESDYEGPGNRREEHLPDPNE